MADIRMASQIARVAVLMTEMDSAVDTLNNLIGKGKFTLADMDAKLVGHVSEPKLRQRIALLLVARRHGTSLEE